MSGPPPGAGLPGGMKRGGRAGTDASDSWRDPIKGATPDYQKRGGRSKMGLGGDAIGHIQTFKKGGKSKRPHAEYKRGGKVAPHMTAGAGGGLGRLEKAEAEARSEGGKRACWGKS